MLTIPDMTVVIHAHLDEQPEDWVARLQLADLLDEAGQDKEAQYQRWAAKFKKRPQRMTRTAIKPWHWFVGNQFPCASVGILAYRMFDYYSGFVSRQAAEHALLRQLEHDHWPSPCQEWWTGVCTKCGRIFDEENANGECPWCDRNRL